MADNFVAQLVGGTNLTFRSKDLASVHYPYHINADSSGAEILSATSTLQTAGNVLLGAVTETAPVSDTASSGLNGRLQRIAQRITSLITTVSRSTSIDDAADVSLNNGSETQVVGADATRHEAIITSLTTNTVAIRIGKTGQVGSGRGAAIMPGQSITLETTAAIYAYAGAASQTLAVTLLKD